VSKLVLFMPDGNTLDVRLARERTTIGRRADNDICVPDLAVSGEHAVVVTILADSFLEDLGSTNGTLVNGKAIGKHFLRDRDRIEIGHHRLVYCADDDATMTSEVVGTARSNARDFGERVDTAKPFVRERVLQERAKAASDAPAAPSAAAEPQASVLAAAVVDTSAPAAPPADSPPAPAAALPGPPASIKVLSGFNAGMSIPLRKAETTIGRPGVQVASIVQSGAGFKLLVVEGISPPALNGRPIGSDGAELARGDVIEIAGTRLEFVDGESI
jgi:pSer/pThr/pTyr-binding forkhead associated (FHA) protein